MAVRYPRSSSGDTAAAAGMAIALAFLSWPVYAGPREDLVACFFSDGTDREVAAACFLPMEPLKPKRYPMFVGEGGTLHGWSSRDRTYCYLNEYQAARCITRENLGDYVCTEIDGQAFCRKSQR